MLSRISASSSRPRALVWSGVLLAALSSATTSWAESAAPAQMGGSWQLQVESAMGKRSPTVDLVQRGTALTGTYHGAFGESPVTGSVEGNRFTFTFEARAMMRSARVTYRGALEGNSISGRIEAAGMGEGSFTGTRKSR